MDSVNLRDLKRRFSIDQLRNGIINVKNGYHAKRSFLFHDWRGENAIMILIIPPGYLESGDRLIPGSVKVNFNVDCDPDYLKDLNRQRK